MNRDATIAALHRDRPRSKFARGSGIALLGLAVTAWFAHDFGWRRLFSERSARNFERFRREITPYPLQGREFDWGVYADWFTDTLSGKFAAAIVSTVALSVAAICLAGLFGGFASLLAARTLATPEPFLPGPRRPGRWVRFGWRVVCSGTRVILIFLRAIPEFTWAYLFKAMLGLTAWPAVLALAAHNGGILGKLNAEVVENLDPRQARAMRALGARRLQIASTAVFPAALNRFLLYFFYRWETCVREATVLGLLGFVSLGWFITDAQVRTKYDEMVLFVLLGSAIILAGDLLSALARGLIRRAGT